MDRIAKGLEADGILTGAGKTKWWTSTINKILRNEKYIDEALVKRWLERITVWEDHFTVELKSELKIDDMAHLSNMFSSLPESVNAMWSVNFDDAMPTDIIRLSIILSGKELR